MTTTIKFIGSVNDDPTEKEITLNISGDLTFNIEHEITPEDPDIEPDNIDIWEVHDLHLQDSMKDTNSNPVNGRLFNESHAKLRKLISLALEKKPAILLLSELLDLNGDLNYLVKQFQRLEGSGILVVYFPGNHGFDSYSYPDLKDNLMESNLVENGGSIFNQAYVLDPEGENILIISLDSNFNTNGEHAGVVTGHVPTEGKSWLESTLLNSTCNKCIICIHHPISQSYYPSSLDIDDAHDLNDIVNDVQMQRQLVVNFISGHYHTPVVLEDNSFPGMNCYITPDSIEQSGGTLNKYKVLPDGTLQITSDPLEYPFLGENIDQQDFIIELSENLDFPETGQLRKSGGGSVSYNGYAMEVREILEGEAVLECRMHTSSGIFGFGFKNADDPAGFDLDQIKHKFLINAGLMFRAREAINGQPTSIGSMNPYNYGDRLYLKVVRVQQSPPIYKVIYQHALNEGDDLVTIYESEQPPVFPLRAVIVFKTEGARILNPILSGENLD